MEMDVWIPARNAILVALVARYSNSSSFFLLHLFIDKKMRFFFILLIYIVFLELHL